MRTMRIGRPGWATAALLALLLAGCREQDPTMPDPDEKDGGVAAARVPGFVLDYFRDQRAGVDSAVIRVWAECEQNGTAAMAGTPYVAGVNCRLVPVSEYLRRFIVYVPASVAQTPDQDVPVVVMHHGSSGTGEQFLHTSGWREKADAEGLIAVFPTGAVYFVLDKSRYSTKWNDFTLAADVDTTLKPIGYPLTAPWPADDVRFENTILDDLEALLPVDQSRVYAAGFSNGGGFTSRLAVEVSNRFAAAGAMAGALGQEYVPVERIPVIYGLGTLDDRVLEQVNPALLALGRDTITALPLDPDSLLDLPQVPTVFAAIANTFDLEPDVYTVRSDGTTNTIFGWTTPQAGNTDGNVFYFGLLAGVTHQYPRGPLGPHGSNNPNNFDATEVFWPFFRAHPKN